MCSQSSTVKYYNNNNFNLMRRSHELLFVSQILFHGHNYIQLLLSWKGMPKPQETKIEMPKPEVTRKSRYQSLTKVYNLKKSVELKGYVPCAEHHFVLRLQFFFEAICKRQRNDRNVTFFSRRRNCGPSLTSRMTMTQFYS